MVAIDPGRPCRRFIGVPVSSRTVVHPGAYRDSIELMRMTLEIEAVPGVLQASVMMATPSNLELLNEVGLLQNGTVSAGPRSPGQ